MIFANWLAQVDRPASRRAPIVVPSPILLYADDPTAPSAARALGPGELARLIGQNVLSSHIFQGDPFAILSSTLWEDGGPLALERKRRSALIVRLAAELYRRENGQPPTTAGALVGLYLGELPEGIAASDPIPEVKD